MIRPLLLAYVVFFLAKTVAFADAVKFQSVNSLYGISVRAVNALCRDDNGFIWASSRTGILRLTGDDYRLYELPYETSGAIIVKLVYQNNRLIAYTNNGQFFQYNTVSDRFELVVNLDSIADDPHFDVYHMLVGPDGDFWIGLSTGLHRYSQGTLTHAVPMLGARYSMTWYDSEHMLVAGPDGILVLDIKTLEMEPVYDSRSQAPNAIASVFFEKAFNRLWMGTLSDGLYCFDIEMDTLQQVLESILPRQPILAITENSDSTLLIGVDGQGIWEIEKNSQRLLSTFKEYDEDPLSLKGNGVYDILVEPGRRVWVGTISGGVSFYDLSTPVVTQIVQQANNVNSLVNNDVNAILEDSDGKLWFATNNGISVYDARSDRWKSIFKNKLEQAQVFLALCEDDLGRIWAGSYSSGFYVLDRDTGSELAHYARYPGSLSRMSNFIFDIQKDSDGDLWIGGVNGEFVSYRIADGRFINYPEEPVSSFYELEPGKILIGLSYGLSMLDKQTGDITTLLTGILVQDMMVVNNTIWLCTSGEGLVSYDFSDASVTKYNTQVGLPSNFVNSIAYCDGYLWLGTENGLCRFHPTEKTTRTFPTVEPLSGFSYNKSAVFRLRSGQLSWGTNQGVVIFRPASLREIPFEGRLFFQDVLISGRSVRDIPSFGLQMPVDDLESLQVKHYQNTFMLELLTLGAPPGTRYSWFLEGFDKEWTAPTGNRFITYTNLPDGQFKLLVKLWDNTMSQVLDTRTLDIRVIPPLWRTSWFIILLVLVAAGMVFTYIFLYVNRLKQKHAEEKVRFFTNTAHEIRTSLTLINAPMGELSKETLLSDTGKYFLHLALDQTKKLSSAVTQLMDFQKADAGKEPMTFVLADVVKLVQARIIMFRSLAEKRHIFIRFNSNQASYESNMDVVKIEKVVDNLISNAIKYSVQGSEVLVDLTCEHGQWTLKVEDQGIGISRKAQEKLFREFYRGENAVNAHIIGSGIGLLLARKYVAMHGGKIACESRENEGSLFIVVVPRKLESQGAVLVPVVTEEGHGSQASITEALPERLAKISKPAGSMHILVVEDNEDLLHFMQTTLEKTFHVSIARDGQEAWQSIMKKQPGLVVSDIMMPGMDGFELCGLLKSTYETAHIPIILLTALSERSKQLNGLGLGADDYLTKPFDMDLLIHRISSIVHNRQLVTDRAFRMIRHDSDDKLLINEHNDKFLKRALKVANENLANIGFGKEEFARAMHVSSSLLYKKMKSLTHVSPAEFVKLIRLNHAAGLLQGGKHSITEVSELCGFGSAAYFSTAFKKHFKKSPKDFRG